MKDKLLVTLIVMSLFLISGGLAEAQTLESLNNIDTNTPIGLIQTCATCTFNNLTSFTYVPSSDEIVSNVVMTRDGSEYNYTIAGQTRKGEYLACGVGDIDGSDRTWCFKVFVGKSLSLAESFFYMILMGLSVFSFILFTFYGIKIPLTNERNEEGAITRITKFKYLKLLSIWFAFGSAIWFLNLLTGVFNFFVTSDFGYTLVSRIYLVSLTLTYGATITILGLLFIFVYWDMFHWNEIKKWGKSHVEL